MVMGADNQAAPEGSLSARHCTCVASDAGAGSVTGRIGCGARWGGVGEGGGSANEQSAPPAARANTRQTHQHAHSLSMDARKRHSQLQ